MTSYKGIAAVSQTLGFLISAAIRDAVPNAGVSFTSPADAGAGLATDPRLNIYLVQASPEAAIGSSQVPKPASGNLDGPQAAVNLRYLLSFFGSSQDAQLMLGATAIALQARPVLDPTLISQALASHPELQDSGLERQVSPVRIAPTPVTLEELSRIWSGLTQTPYTLSTLYEAMPIIFASS